MQVGLWVRLSFVIYVQSLVVAVIADTSLGFLQVQSGTRLQESQLLLGMVEARGGCSRISEGSVGGGGNLDVPLVSRA